MLLIPMLFHVLIPNMMFLYSSNNYKTTNTPHHPRGKMLGTGGFEWGTCHHFHTVLFTLMHLICYALCYALSMPVNKFHHKWLLAIKSHQIFGSPHPHHSGPPLSSLFTKCKPLPYEKLQMLLDKASRIWHHLNKKEYHCLTPLSCTGYPEGDVFLIVPQT